MDINLKERSHVLPLQKCIAGEEIRNLSDTELLAVLLGSGTRKGDVIDLSSGTLKEFGGLGGLFQSGIREIAGTHGIGLKKAIRIHTAFEMGRRIITDRNNMKFIDSPEAVWKLLLPEMAAAEKEIFMTLVVNNKNCLLKKVMVSVGTVSETIVHPREVFREAIREGGSSVIVAHNHPSGNLSPSREDVVTTRRIKEAGKIIGIPLLDHIIITNTSFFSLKEGGYFD